MLLTPVVEQLQIELLDAAVDDEVIDVGELADDADRAAGDRVRERREPRLEETQVRIERRVGEPERQLGVHLVGQRDAAGAGHDEAGRRGLELDRQQLAAQRQPAGQLADAFVAGEEVVHSHAHVVAGHIERAGCLSR